MPTGQGEGQSAPVRASGLSQPQVWKNVLTSLSLSFLINGENIDLSDSLST